jgi:uncharacterized protein YegP (UPF0339 family)
MERSQGKIIIDISKNGGWYFKLVAENGRTLCHSEVYKTLNGVKKGAKAVQDLCQQEEVAIVVVAKKPKKKTLKSVL